MHSVVLELVEKFGAVGAAMFPRCGLSPEFCPSVPPHSPIFSPLLACSPMLAYLRFWEVVLLRSCLITVL